MFAQNAPKKLRSFTSAVMHKGGMVLRRRHVVGPPPQLVFDRFEQLMKNSVWRRSVEENVRKRTPYVNLRSVEIITALWVYQEEQGVKGLSLEHLRYLIPKLTHAQMHRLGDFLITRVNHNSMRYRYYLDPQRGSALFLRQKGASPSHE